MNISGRNIRLGLCITFISFIYSCSPTKKLKEGESLLRKNIIHGNISSIDKSELESYIRINPNYKLLGFFRFHLWLHNMANEERIEKKRTALNEKRKRKNEHRIVKGKDVKTKSRTLFGEWLLNIGEAPVVCDSFLVRKSSQQMKFYLNNKGYFLSTVKDSIHYNNKGNKATVYYKINLNTPYHINDITYEIRDEKIKTYVLTDTLNSLLQKANNYDLDIIEEERERLTYLLNNEGYYLFNKEYIFFKVDTLTKRGAANIVIGIKDPYKTISSSDTTIDGSHKQFYINRIFVETNFSPLRSDSIKYDTLYEGEKGEYMFIFSSKLDYKTRVLVDALKFLGKGDLYRFKNLEITYKRLSELKAFKYINISFTEIDSNRLDCRIQLSPLMKQAITLETEGTNSSGNLGISGSFIYQNKNLFRGAEIFELKLKGGVSSQRILDEKSSNNLTLSSTPALNTVEFGPEMNIYVPRFLLPFHVKTYRLSNPKTVFTSGLNYQRRPDYSRIITNFSLGYTWKESSKKQHAIYPFVIDFVKVDLQPDFYARLDTLVQNKFIINSFSNHMTTSTRYTFIYNGQDLKKENNFSFFRGNVETSGNILRGIYNLSNQLKPNAFVKDTQGRYTLLDIAYSQYVRTDVDYRYYFNLRSLGKIVFRIAGGIGKPLVNFKVLPFERSFFSGGTNGLRAWQSRTIGPGSYFNKDFSYDRFGDGQLEGNIEHRFKIFKMLNGAVFIDAGNIWLEKPDANRPGGEFKINTFYKQIAIGTGLGLRFDFSFFIIRLDLGIKAKDPQFAENQRWVLQNIFNKSWKHDYFDKYNSKYNFTTLNIGIGYPF